MKARNSIALAACFVAIVAACAPSDFTPADAIVTVRILSTRADFDEAYAKPGDTVTLETLAVDGRPNPPSPMTLYWIPFVCSDPANDLYAACFTSGQTVSLDAGVPNGGSIDGGGAGAPDAAPDGAATVASIVSPQASASSLFPPGTDLTPYLPTGPRFAFKVPENVIAKHPVIPGAPDPYGLVIVFNIACAGHVELTAIDPNGGPQQVPLGCFDASGHALGADDYVIGFTRVYVHANLPNANPTVAGVLFDGTETATAADPARPPGDAHDVPAAVEWTVPACGSGCNSPTLAVDVPASSWEVDPSDKDSSGTPRHETLWVDYFATGGNLNGSGQLLYDAVDGQITGAPGVTYTPPVQPGEAVIYAIVHDNRDGVTWVQINVHAR